MSRDYNFVPDPASKLTFEWVWRQFEKIQYAIGGSSDGSGGGGRSNITSIVVGDSPYDMQNRDDVLLVDPVGGAITINLTGSGNKREVYIKNTATSGSNNVTVVPDGSDDIDRTGANWVLAVMDSIHIVYDQDTANWFVI